MKKVNWKYAVGEVIIVMIGILLAFQLQNWNESMKDKSLVDSYLSNPKENLLQDQNQIAEQRSVLQSIDSSLNQLNQYLYQRQNVVLTKDEMALIHQLSNWYYLIIRSTTFNDLFNSGRLNLLPDLDLRLDLSTYYEYSELVKSFDQGVAQSQLSFTNIIVQMVPFGRDSWNVTEKEADQLINMAWYIKGRITNTLMHLENLQDINADIVSSIDGLL